MAELKEFVDFMSSNQKVFKSVKKIDIKLLGSRKKIDIFSSVDLKSFYHVTFWIESKSRFLLSHVKEIEALEKNLTLLENHNYKYKHIYVKEALCSKAKEYLKQMGWKVYNGLV